MCSNPTPTTVSLLTLFGSLLRQSVLPRLRRSDSPPADAATPSSTELTLFVALRGGVTTAYPSFANETGSTASLRHRRTRYSLSSIISLVAWWSAAAGRVTSVFESRRLSLVVLI